MSRIGLRISLFILGTTLTVLFACAPRVMVPPQIDLRDYGNVALIQFSSNAEGNLQEFVTQKFLQSIQTAQPGVRVIEIGDEEQVLTSIERERLDLEAIKTIGEKYNVEAILTGQLDVSDVKPRVDISALLRSMSVSADVEATLSTKLLETFGGATLWTSTSKGKEAVADVTVFSGGPFLFDATDPENAYGKLVDRLIKEGTRDFRVRYERTRSR